MEVAMEEKGHMDERMKNCPELTLPGVGEVVVIA